MSKISVVGSFVMDLIGTVEDFPKDGQTVIGKTFYTMPGGKGANQAVAAARLGADVAMFGRVGEDGYGDTFLKLFREEGIDVSNVKQLVEQPTALGLIQINNRAENKIVVIPGANYGYTLEDVTTDADKFLASEYVIVQLELLLDVTYAIIKRCHDAGVKVILNPAPAVPIPNEVLSMVSILTPNETELEILTGMSIGSVDDAKAAMQKLLDLGVEHVVATLGKNGALVGDSAGFDLIPGYSVDAIDTVAAGDSFNGALATGLTKGMTLREAARYANAVGALTVTKKGAIPALPNAEEVNTFILGSPNL